VFVTLPAVQFVQALTFDSKENRPAVQAVQRTAPASDPVSVIDPLPHAIQEGAPVLAAYFPTTHLVQLLAPISVPVSVIEPALQALQSEDALAPVLFA
jgi:hypothetical protein